MNTSNIITPMSQQIRRVTSLIIIGFASAMITPASATTVIAPGFSEMVARAELIFTAKVSKVHSEWRVKSGHRCIVTTADFSIEQMHKGSAAKSVQLEFLGGTVGEDAMEVQGVPKFRVGERVILFSRQNGKQFCPLVGIFYGKLVIERSQVSNSDVVLRHDRLPVKNTSDVGTDITPQIVSASGPNTRAPMSVEAFIEALDKELLKQGKR